jgi:glycosyltransferase involved in cell wall biosynthesis
MEIADWLLRMGLSQAHEECMKVLLSAYACEPGKGSEQEIGWQRALHMQPFADEVWVLTRSNNRGVIEADPLSRKPGLHFIYFDLSTFLLKLKKLPGFLPIYIMIWQWGAYRLAAKLHQEERFDKVFHVTFTGMLSGSFMGRLGIPLIVGPIGGGERAPISLRRGMPALYRVKERLRDVGIVLQRYNPLTCPALAAAEHIYVTTPESLRLVQSRWHSKTGVQLSVGHCGESARRPERRASSSPQFVFVGRLLHWKGVHLAIRALAEARRTIPAATLTLFGQGPAKQWLRDLAKQCGVADAVEFTGHIPRQQLADSLSAYTALVFPSLHDSGGLAVLEALSKGLPVVCLDLGGPGVMVNASCGIVISTANSDETETVAGIASAMVSLGTMAPPEFEHLSTEAITRAQELSWSSLTERIVECEDLCKYLDRK